MARHPPCILSGTLNIELKYERFSFSRKKKEISNTNLNGKFLAILDMIIADNIFMHHHAMSTSIL
jgi:hypothetical protein